MIMVNIHEAKTHLSRYLSQLDAEGKIILCRHNKPVAEILPIRKETQQKARPIGLAKKEFSLTDAFFDELPDEVVKPFHSEAE